MDRRPLHEDKRFEEEAQRFRKSGDNAPRLRQRLVELGYDDEALLLDRLQRLSRPIQRDRTPVMEKSWWGLISKDKEKEKVGWNFRALPDEKVDAVEWLDSLGATRIDQHFQCHWAACTMVVTADGWQRDQVVRRGRRWHLHPPELLRAIYLLHWEDHRDVHRDWQLHLARVATLNSHVNATKVMQAAQQQNRAWAMPLVLDNVVKDKIEVKEGETLTVTENFTFE